MEIIYTPNTDGLMGALLPPEGRWGIGGRVCTVRAGFIGKSPSEHREYCWKKFAVKGPSDNPSTDDDGNHP